LILGGEATDVFRMFFEKALSPLTSQFAPQRFLYRHHQYSVDLFKAELESIYKFRKEAQHVEREYLELRILLRDSEAALRADRQRIEM